MSGNSIYSFTVDVEDYYQVSAFDRNVSRSQWDSYPSRVVNNTRRMLDLLAEFQVRGTFFVLGWVADRHPQLVREIDRAGHQVGSHSYWHRLIYQQTPDEFRADLRQSLTALQQAIGRPVTTYRAPTFSITPKSKWAFNVLVEEGICVDSSVVPSRHRGHGWPGFSAQPQQIETPSGSLTEIPVSVAQFGPLRLPLGGGYFRLLPYAVSRNLLRRLTHLGQPKVFYIHPWEIDAGQPNVDGAARRARWRHRVNLASTEQKLRRLLGDRVLDEPCPTVEAA